MTKDAEEEAENYCLTKFVLTFGSQALSLHGGAITETVAGSFGFVAGKGKTCANQRSGEGLGRGMVGRVL